MKSPKLPESLNSLTQSELMSEINALRQKPKWDDKDRQYLAKLLKAYHERLEADVKETEQ